MNLSPSLYSHNLTVRWTQKNPPRTHYQAQRVQGLLSCFPMNLPAFQTPKDRGEASYRATCSFSMHQCSHLTKEKCSRNWIEKNFGRPETQSHMVMRIKPEGCTLILYLCFNPQSWQSTLSLNLRDIQFRCPWFPARQ